MTAQINIYLRTLRASALRLRRLSLLAAISPLLFIAPALPLLPAQGGLDPTFSDDGVFTIDLGMGLDQISDIKIQPDGKSVAIGSGVTQSGPQANVIRLNQDGSLDDTFGTGGVVSLKPGGNPAYGEALALTPGGDIIGVGSMIGAPSTSAVIFALKADGTLDSSFSTGGFASVNLTSGPDSATDIVRRSTGEFVVSAVGDAVDSSQPFILQFDEDGNLDSGFSGDGILPIPLPGDFKGQLKGIGLQSNGNAVAAGEVRDGSQQDFLFASVTPTGNLNPDFDSDGVLFLPVGSGNDAAEDMVILNDDSIVAVGSATVTSAFNFALAKLQPDGMIDNDFGTNGRVITPVVDASNIAQAVAAANGSLYVTGIADLALLNSAIALVRYDAEDGSLDADFNDDGKVFLDQTGGFDVGLALAIQADCKPLVSGSADNLMPGADALVARFVTEQTECNGHGDDHNIYLPIIFK